MSGSEGVHRQLFPRCRCRQYITHDFQHKSQENEDSHAKVTYPTFHLRHGILQTTFTNASPTWLHLHNNKIRFDPYNAQVMTWLQHYISKPIHKPALLDKMRNVNACELAFFGSIGLLGLRLQRGPSGGEHEEEDESASVGNEEQHQMYTRFLEWTGQRRGDCEQLRSVLAIRDGDCKQI